MEANSKVEIDCRKRWDLENFFVKSKNLCLKHKFWTNLPVGGWVSIDRSMVAALLSTTPRQVPRSSTDDSVQEFSNKKFLAGTAATWHA